MKPVHFLFGFISLLWVHCFLLIVSPLYLEARNDNFRFEQPIKTQQNKNIQFVDGTTMNYGFGDTNSCTKGHDTVLK